MPRVIPNSTHSIMYIEYSWYNIVQTSPVPLSRVDTVRMSSEFTILSFDRFQKNSLLTVFATPMILMLLVASNTVPKIQKVQFIIQKETLNF